MKIPSKELLSEVLNDKKILLSKNDLLIGDNVLLFDNQCNYLFNINIYELAFLTRNYLHKKYGYSLDMSLEIGEIFKNATQFYESML